MDEPSRSEQITDALIARGLIRTDGGVTCPDASLLAGLHEGSLETDEAERWMAHLAGCRRCQETLAALARADADARPAQATAPSWWSQVQRGLRWPVLAPLAAGAVVVLAVWVTAPAPTVDRRESAPERSTETATQSAVGTTTEPVPQLTSEANPQTVSETATRLAQDGDAGAATDAELEMIAAPKLQAVPPPEDVLETVMAQPADSTTAITQRARPSALSPSDRTGAAAGDTALPRAEQFVAAAADPVILRSPQDTIQWRASRGGDIARTDDGGLTWRVQLTVPEPIVAGTAPSISVAWLVGERGLVLRTVDGQQWVRTSVPVAAPLADVDASDELRATVTTADGRQFRTVDGGARWTPLR